MHIYQLHVLEQVTKPLNCSRVQNHWTNPKPRPTPYPYTLPTTIKPSNSESAAVLTGDRSLPDRSQCCVCPSGNTLFQARRIHFRSGGGQKSVCVWPNPKPRPTPYPYTLPLRDGVNSVE